MIKTLKEMFMRGVPDFLIAQSTDECILRLKRHLVMGINQRGKTPLHKREMIASMNNMLTELQKELNETISEHVQEFLSTDVTEAKKNKTKI